LRGETSLGKVGKTDARDFQLVFPRAGSRKDADEHGGPTSLRAERAGAEVVVLVAGLKGIADVDVLAPVVNAQLAGVTDDLFGTAAVGVCADDVGGRADGDRGALTVVTVVSGLAWSRPRAAARVAAGVRVFGELERDGHTVEADLAGAKSDGGLSLAALQGVEVEDDRFAGALIAPLAGHAGVIADFEGIAEVKGVACAVEGEFGRLATKGGDIQVNDGPAGVELW